MHSKLKILFLILALIILYMVGHGLDSFFEDLFIENTDFDKQHLINQYCAEECIMARTDI